MNLSGSFWATAFGTDLGNAVSPINSILERDQFTLHELLAEGDFIQEVKTLNMQLIDFISQTESIRGLIDVFSESSEHRLAFSASEVFACDVQSLLDVFFKDPNDCQLLDHLFAFLSRPKPLQSTNVGYFCKVVGILCTRKNEELMNYVRSHPELLPYMLQHLESVSISDLLCSLIWESSNGENGSNSQQDIQWFFDQGLIPALIAKFSSENTSVHPNVAKVLSIIISKSATSNFLITQLQGSADDLFGHVFGESRSAQCNCLLVLTALLNRTVQNWSDQEDHDDLPLPLLLQFTQTRISGLSELLSKSPESTLPTPYGMLNPPLGSLRLRIIEFAVPLFCSNISALQSELLSSAMLVKILDIFFQFPFHSIMHGHVDKIITYILNHGSADLQQSLFSNCELLRRIHDILSSVGSTIRPGQLGFVNRYCNILAQHGNSDKPLFKFRDEAVWNMVEPYVQTQNQNNSVALGGTNPLAAAAVSVDDDIFSADSVNKNAPTSLVSGLSAIDPVRFLGQYLMNNFSSDFSAEDLHVEDDEDDESMYTNFSGRGGAFRESESIEDDESRRVRIAKWAASFDLRGDSDDDDDINNSASGTEEDVIFSASTGRQPFRFQSDDVDHSEHQNVFTQNKPSWLPSESATDFDFSSQNSLQFEWTDATITADPVDDEFEHEDK
jgi:serine/threonine-protein phosphatase 6 regulatory subunit 3